MSELRQLLDKKPVDLVLESLITFGGLALTLFSGSTVWGPPVGAFFMSLGGILLSWTVATIRADQRVDDLHQRADEAQRKADERLHAVERDAAEKTKQALIPQLDTLGRHLGTAAGEVGAAISGVHSGKLDSETGFALVAQAAQTMYGLVNDIRFLTGKPFETTSLVETVGLVKRMASELFDLTRSRELDVEDPQVEPGEGDENVELLGRVQELEGLVEMLRTQIVRPTSIPSSTQLSVASWESIGCPSCKHQVKALIGGPGGSTVRIRCPQCSEPFNAHRHSNGSVFSRVHRESVPLRPWASDVERYRRILRWQGIRDLIPQWRRQGLECLAELFQEVEQDRGLSFEEIDNRLGEKLTARDPSLGESDARKLRTLAFRARVFESLQDGKGVRPLGRPDGITLERTIQGNLVDRIVSVVGNTLNVAAVCEVVCGSHEANLEEVERLIREVTSHASSQAQTAGPGGGEIPPAGRGLPRVEPPSTAGTAP